MKKKPELTENQNRILLDLSNEFLAINKAKPVKKINNVIDEIYEMGQDFLQDASDFYEDIMDHNKAVKAKASAHLEDIYQELLELFSDYEVKVFKDKKGYILVNTLDDRDTLVYINAPCTLMRTTGGSQGWQYAPNQKSVTKCDKYYISINSSSFAVPSYPITEHPLFLKYIQEAANKGYLVKK